MPRSTNEKDGNEKEDEYWNERNKTNTRTKAHSSSHKGSKPSTTSDRMVTNEGQANSDVHFFNLKRCEERKTTAELDIDKDGLEIVSVRRKRKVVRDFMDLTSSSKLGVTETSNNGGTVSNEMKVIKKK